MGERKLTPNEAIRLAREVLCGAECERQEEYAREAEREACPECAALRAQLAEAQAARERVERERPEIVCLCGSTRFKRAYEDWNAQLTAHGRIVLSVGVFKGPFMSSEAEKAELDELHLRKIDMADRVFVLDVGGYVGDSTKREIAYAEAHGKPVDRLSVLFPGYQEPADAAEARCAALESAISKAVEDVRAWLFSSSTQWEGLCQVVDNLEAALTGAKEGT